MNAVPSPVAIPARATPRQDASRCAVAHVPARAAQAHDGSAKLARTVRQRQNGEADAGASLDDPAAQPGPPSAFDGRPAPSAAAAGPAGPRPARAVAPRRHGNHAALKSVRYVQIAHRTQSPDDALLGCGRFQRAAPGRHRVPCRPFGDGQCPMRPGAV
jgi:hypothetical protein